MLRSNLLSAFRSLREQRSRAALSAVGIGVGSLAILLLISIARGVQADIGSEIKDIGVNVLVVLPGRVEEGNFNPNLGGQSFLGEEDADRLRKDPGVVRVALLTFAGGGVRAGKRDAYPVVIAATPEWFSIHPTKLGEGRALGPEDESADAVLLGSIAKKALFGDQPAVGKSVFIDGRTYTVVGVTIEQNKGTAPSMFSMMGFENVAYLPFHRLRRQRPDMQIDRIMIQSDPSAEPKELRGRLEKVMAERLDRQQFSVLTQEDLLGLVYKIMGILTWLLMGLTSIALFVGGVGIMTVMLMSVSERGKEIGIRKAVGAKRSDVFVQFLAEALLVATAGGMAGLLLSTFICLLLERFTPIKPIVSLGTVGLALGVSWGVGTVFGLIPAVRAARKDPVVALRWE